MKVAILGFGREGKSTLAFLRKSKEYRNAEFWILDAKKDVPVPRGTKSVLGKHYLANLGRFDLIFRAPGVPYTLPQLYRARCDGVRVTSATKLFFELAKSHRKKLIGITGTKGKGTTATLLAEILRRAGRRVLLAGNIGKPMLDIVPQIPRVDFIVLELSSFQLQDLPVSPHIAVVLDVFPDHLDQHKTLREYYGSKANIARFQKGGDMIFYFADNTLSRRVAQKSPARKIAVVPRRSGVKKNYDMAAAVAQTLGVNGTLIRRVIQKFKGLEHRLEFVREVRGIRFINDSAATNPAASAAAVRSFSEPNVLIAGGYDKGLNYRPLAEALRTSGTAAVVLFGENKKKIARAIRSSGVPLKLARDLKTALAVAYHIAQSLSPKSYHLKANVILSPGAASFDMFKNYADRGDQFKKLVRRLTERGK